MKKNFILLSALLLSMFPFSARADVDSCTNRLLKNDIDSGPFTWQGGKVIQTERYKGVNYHLIFLDGGWKEVELVIKENAQVCEKLVFNPTGHDIDYSDVMPEQVAKPLRKALRGYSALLWEKMKSNQ